MLAFYHGQLSTFKASEDRSQCLHRFCYSRTPSGRGAELVKLLSSAQVRPLSLYLSSLIPHRWGHAATYLGRPSTLLIHGGKTSSGYSYASAPNTADLLSLDLSSSFDLSAPPWRIAPVGTAPSTSFHSLSSLGEDVGSSSTQLLFGGDETGVALPSFNDSSWLLSVNTPFSAAATATWADQPASWATEPLRRIRHTATSITSGANSRTYVYGGLRSDGAGLAYGELWQMDAEAESVATSAIWRLVTTTGTAPPATYDHSATWLNGALIVIGGVSVAGSTSSMNDLGTIWRFSPTSNAAGEWTAIPVEGTVPAVRRGHAAIALDGGRILIHGGATLDEATAYDDMAILTVTGTSASWSRITATGSGPAGRWGHSAIYVANTVLYAFGAHLQYACEHH